MNAVLLPVSKPLAGQRSCLSLKKATPNSITAPVAGQDDPVFAAENPRGPGLGPLGGGRLRRAVHAGGNGQDTPAVTSADNVDQPSRRAALLLTGRAGGGRRRGPHRAGGLRSSIRPRDAFDARP